MKFEIRSPSKTDVELKTSINLSEKIKVFVLEGKKKKNLKEYNNNENRTLLRQKEDKVETGIALWGFFFFFLSYFNYFSYLI